MPPATPGSSPSDLSRRAIAAGCAIGVLFSVANVYMSLKTGLWDGGFPTGAILAFGVMGALTMRTSSPYNAGENLVTQAVAAAAGVMPATAGLLGAFPALSLMGRHYPAWIVAGWGFALGILGLICALPIWRRLVLEEKLPFPTGVATGEVIAAMHAAGATGYARARALLTSGGVALALTWFRDGPWAWVPAVTPWPLRVAGQPAASLTLGMSWSPLLLGAGALIGPQIGLSMLLGGLVAWGWLAPYALRVNEVKEATFAAIIAWLTWPGVGLMVTGALAGLAFQAPTFLRSLKDLRSIGARSKGEAVDPEMSRPQLHRLLWLGALALGLALFLGWRAFDLHPLLTLAFLAVSALLVSAAARAAGETDFMPLGPLGQLGQVMLGPATHGVPAANIAGGSVAAGLPAQGVTLIYMRVAGRTVPVPLRTLIACALIGIAVGTLTSVPAYLLITGAYGLGSEALPAASARTWKAVAEVVTGGVGGIPSHAAAAAWVAIAVGGALALLSRGRLARWLPSAVGLGMGFIIPASYSAAICAGALSFALARRWRRDATERLGPAVAAGAIAGESLMGVTIAILLSLGLLRSHP